MFIGSRMRIRATASALAACGLLLAMPALAQQPAPSADHSHMNHGKQASSAAPAMAQHDHSQHGDTAKPKKKSKAKKDKPAQIMRHDGHAMKKAAAGGVQGHDAAGHGPASHDMGGMRAFLGPYGFTREGSGTSWLPDATPHEGIHAKYGEWNTMWHALINGVYDNQGGPRGGNKTFASGMLMGMAQRDLGDGSTLGFRAMLSPEPFMGASGYPLLFATGETANGRNHLVDRQHPHDLFMEMATTYSRNLSANSSVFLYAGLPGEPALGPAAFMHRTSGADIPEAPITHHWLDSTHITFGVVTGGLVVDTWKIEASAFRGREPDQYRYDIEAPKLDSVSTRLSWNPAKEWSMQVSWGRIRSPEQLASNVDENRFTASAIYTKPFGDNLWSTTVAWGHKTLQPGNTSNALLLESTLLLQQKYTLFMRAERVQQSELFEDETALAVFGVEHPKFNVSKVSVGGIYDFVRTDHAKFGVGALVSFYDMPGALTPYYGDPTSSMVFMRLKVM